MAYSGESTSDVSHWEVFWWEIVLASGGLSLRDLDMLEEKPKEGMGLYLC